MRLSILLLYLLSFMLSPPPPPTTFDIEGHRGCRGLMPENTIPAFLKALDLGVTTLEMDVVVSQDRQVVVSHEPYFNADFSIAPDGRPVDKAQQQQLVLYQMPYEQIRQYDTGSNGNPKYPEQQKQKTHKPLLTDVIEQVEASITSPSCRTTSRSRAMPMNTTEASPNPRRSAIWCRAY